MKPKEIIILAMQILILHNFLVTSQQDDVCPELCQPCLREAVVCTTPGRTTLPEAISSTVERLTIVNQKFSQTYLSSENFTQFAPPHISLKQLAIRHCNIETIEAKTFSSLTKLESMDLSNNYNLKISSDAFSGLKLRYLQMNNLKLKLGPYVFRGLVVTSLSLTSCSLTSIDYETLHPLGRTLSKLFLNNNHLRVLDPKLQLIFQKLESFDLTGNPLNCNCNMKWLMDFYRENIQNPNFNDKRFNNQYNLIPRCQAPIYVRDKFLTEVNSTELICESPHISELDIKLNPLSDARLICSGYQNALKAPMQISWFNTGNDVDPLGSEMFTTGNGSSKEVSIKFLSEVAQYKCVVNNSVGQASAIVTINWPDIAKTFRSENNGPYITDPITQDKKIAKSWNNVFFERRFTLLEIISAVTGTILVTGLLFIVVHKFILVRCIMVNKKHKKIGSQQSNLATVSLSTSYEPAVYSNSQTYDVPGVGYTGSNLQIATPNCTPQQFLDFKTQRKIYRKL